MKTRKEPYKPAPTPRPFEPGNKVAVKAGAYSSSIVAERSEQVHEHLLEIAPYLDEEAFLPQVARYIEARAIESLLQDYVINTAAERGVERISSRMIEQLNSPRRIARDLAKELGLSPRGHAELRQILTGADVGQASLADLQRRGAEIAARRQREIAEQSEQGEKDS